MIYLDLFLGFLKVGCFAFGGAYGAIPLIRDVVLSYGWLSDEELAYMIAIAESTPGPIMVNLATYVGSSQGGVSGALLATLAVVLPSFFIIILVTSILRNFLKNPYVQAALQGMKPCVVGIILATGAYMAASACVSSFRVDFPTLLLTLLLCAAMAIYKTVRKKKLSPILLIVLSALLGMLIY
ncbi:MAG: chromate transporter [Oscillospiraceae bacterium]|nr:chromate transporter [Oscillospiraceae bacterium]